MKLILALIQHNIQPLKIYLLNDSETVIQIQYNFNGISIVKPTRCTISQIYFILEKKTLHISDGLSVHHQESKTVHTVSGICHTGSVAAC